MDDHSNLVAKDLTEDSLLELMQHIRQQRISVKPQFITMTDENLAHLGWSKEAIRELRRFEDMFRGMRVQQ